MVHERRALGAMVVATLLWGATFVVIRDSLAGMEPAPLVWIRFACAACVLAVVQAARRSLPGPAELQGGTVSGTLAAGGFLFQAVGLAGTSAGSSAFLTFAGTSFAALFAWPLLGERPTRVLLTGIAMALAGSALLSVRGSLAFGTGEVWTLLGALCFALQIVAIGRWAARADAIALVGVQAATIVVLLLPWSLEGTSAMRELDGLALVRLGYLSLAGSVIAPCLQVLAQRRLPAARIGLLFTLEPLFALAFAVTLGAERFAPRWWLGASLILSAVLLVEGRPSRVAASSRASSA